MKRCGLPCSLILALAFLRTASGSPVDAGKATTAVAGWLRLNQTPLQTTLGRLSKGVQTIADANGSPLYHVVPLEPEGFVIVAADDLVEPIVCFAPHGQFDPSADNPLGALVGSDLPGRVARAQAVNATALPALLPTRAKWANLESLGQAGSVGALAITEVSDLRVPPLTHTLWDQTTASAGSNNACYNYYVPPYAPGTSSNYPCGCVATALAQIMFYWHCPMGAVGTNAFNVCVNGVQQPMRLRGGDGVGGPYDWSNMVLDPASGCTLVQCQAIGALCHDAGVAANMNYAAGGSGAAAYHEMDALHAFGYSNAIYSESVGTASIAPADLLAMINPNLDAGGPVQLGIDGAHGAHSVVCDGYGYNLSTLYHHLNLGWAGFDTAWYALPLIDPALLSYTFTSIETVVYNVWTNKTGEILSGRIVSAGGGPLAGAVVTATRSGGGTYTATSDAHGIYALAGIPPSSVYTVSMSKAGYPSTNRIVTTGWSTNLCKASGNRWGIDFVSSEPTVTLGVSGSSLAEAGGMATVTATLSATCALPVTVTLAFSGSATLGTDYTVSSSTIVIPPGSLSGTLTMTGVPDLVKEGSETIVVDIDTVVNASEAGTQQVTATIADGYYPPDSPPNFRATPVNSSRINLAWTPNADTDNVMVAWNSCSNFGTPVRAYVVGDWIPGGGSVLYTGAATNAVHADLAASTPCYYQAWSARGTNYSVAATASATTSNRTVLPFMEGFESNIPSAWSQVFVTGISGWGIVSGHGGGKCVCLYFTNTVVTRLITPWLDLGTAARNPQLTFWHQMQVLRGTQDELRVFYRTNSVGSWALIATYTNNVNWTNRTLALPNPGSTYSVAFEGTAKGGYGVLIDDVAITADYPAPASFSAWAQVRCPGIAPTNAFMRDRDGDGVPNGLEYAYGTNWGQTPGSISVRLVSGVPVADVPKSVPESAPYVSSAVEFTANPKLPAWTTNGVHTIDDTGKPANRDWFQADTTVSNGFFRLRATLLE